MKEEEEGLWNDLNLNLLNKWNQTCKLQQVKEQLNGTQKST